jgi:PAS domain S-box-containing protein
MSALKRQAAFNELMTRTLSSFAITRSSELDAAVERALQSIAEFIGADHAYVIRFSVDNKVWSATHEWCGPNVTPRIQLFQNVPFGTIPLSESRLLAGEITRTNSADDYPPDAVAERSHQANEGFLSELQVPIRTQKGIFGDIGVHSHARPVAWSDEDVSHLRMFGDAMANAVEHQLSVEALRQSEEKFFKAFSLSPVAMNIISLATGRFIDANKAYEHCSGFPNEEIIGRKPQELGIFVDPVDLERLSEALAGNMRLRNFEAQSRTKTGDLRVVLISTEIIEFGGEPCILMVSEDITERKRSERLQREVGARLLMVQEEERTRIARELHDDINQRLALLAIELDECNQSVPKSAVDLHHHFQQAREHLLDIAKDVQSLSHRLHSSKLEYLGVAHAADSFCRELSDQQKVKIDFTYAGVPRDLPKEISLCLFRVLQEALLNAIKHSGGRHFKVELRGAQHEICLSVADSGQGFDPTVASAGRGLGLISMKERVHLINGELDIDSRRNGGTTIRVRAPVHTENSNGIPISRDPPVRG